MNATTKLPIIQKQAYPNSAEWQNIAILQNQPYPFEVTGAVTDYLKAVGWIITKRYSDTVEAKSCVTDRCHLFRLEFVSVYNFQERIES